MDEDQLALSRIDDGQHEHGVINKSSRSKAALQRNAVLVGGDAARGGAAMAQARRIVAAPVPFLCEESEF